MYDILFTKTFRDYGLPNADQFPLSALAERPEILSEAKSRPAAYKQVTDNLLGSRQQIEIKTPVGLVIVNGKTLRHFVEKRASAREKYVNFIRPTLEEPTEIWLQYDPVKKTYRQRFIKIFKTTEKKSNFLVVVQGNSDGNYLLTAFPAKTKYIDGQRKGVLLYGG